jgi:AraC family transcriptional regulator
MGLEPWTSIMHLDRSSSLTKHRYADRFSVVRVETADPLREPIAKSSSVPALLVSVFLRPVAPGDYRLSLDGADVPIGAVPAFAANVVDLRAEPAMWAGRGIDYIHFHVRQSTIDESASDLGFRRSSEFRLAVGSEDLVLAQIARSVAPSLDISSHASMLALDQLELVIGAHLVQRYGESGPPHAARTRGLAAWQRRCATELLRENLGQNVRLADLARACEVSVSHFARSFKASFGVTCHRWLTELRVERAQMLLAQTDASLVEVATQSGFADQSTFTRTFRQLVGIPPGQWRREHAR